MHRAKREMEFVPGQWEHLEFLLVDLADPTEERCDLMSELVNFFGFFMLEYLKAR